MTKEYIMNMTKSIIEAIEKDKATTAEYKKNCIQSIWFQAEQAIKNLEAK